MSQPPVKKLKTVHENDASQRLEENNRGSGFIQKIDKIQFPLADLPDLVLLNVANQLPNNDARNLSLTCKRFQNILPVYKYSKIIYGPNIIETRPHNGNFEPGIYLKCPILDHKVEQIELSLRWKSFGGPRFGKNRQGRVWLQLHRPNILLYGGSELIFETESKRFGNAPEKFETAAHTLNQTEDIVNLAKAGDYYQIMKNVGGHCFSIEDFKLIIHYEPYFE